MQQPVFGKIVKLNKKAWGVFVEQVKQTDKSTAPADTKLSAEKADTILVPFALPEEDLTIERIEQGQGQKIAKAWQLKKASPDRTTPLCPAFGRCPGCSLQHLDYAQQVAWKKSLVQEAFDALKVKQPRLFERFQQKIEFVASPLGFSYRNRLSLQVFLVADQDQSETDSKLEGVEPALGGRLALGYKKDEPPFDPVPIQGCFLAPPDLFQAAEQLLAFLNAKEQKNFFRTPLRLSLRQVRTTKLYIELEIDLEPFRLWASTTWLEEFHSQHPHLALKLKAQTKQDFSTLPFAKTAGKKLLLHKTSYGTELSLHSPAWENEQESFLVGEQLLPLAHENFVQANEAAFQAIFQKILAIVKAVQSTQSAEGQPEKKVSPFPWILELYAGPSTFSYLLRDFAPRYLNLDWIPPLQKIPTPSVSPQDWSSFIQKRQYLVADLHKKLPKRLNELPSDSLCIVNPPRSGLSPSVKRYLNQQKFRHLVYVSCNAQSLSFDLQELAAVYRIEQIEAYDLFPQTLHFETLVWLTAEPASSQA